MAIFEHVKDCGRLGAGESLHDRRRHRLVVTPLKNQQRLLESLVCGMIPAGVLVESELQPPGLIVGVVEYLNVAIPAPGRNAGVTEAA